LRNLYFQMFQQLLKNLKNLNLLGFPMFLNF
jgi:hypothetical protein